MKTLSSIKILLCLLLLPAVHAMASVVNITSDQTDYTFASGTTYYVSASVTLYGTSTFESGTVLKYNTNGQINIPSDGTIVCPSGAQPAIFTSYNDNSVGETIPGSSGTPGIYNINTQTGTDVNTFLNVSNVTLSNMRFSYAYSPFEGYATVTLQNCEFFYDAYMYVQTSQIFNNLFVNVIDLDWFPGSDNDTMQNNTFVNSGVFFDSFGSPTTTVTSDNLFDSTGISDWTYSGTTGGNNAFYNCTDYLGGNAGLPTDTTYAGEPGYETGPLGDYYLPPNSPLIDRGDMLATDAGLDAFTTQITQTPDSGTVDIGYHYPVTDQNYVVLNFNRSNFTFLSNLTYFIDANVTLYGTSTFESGTVLKYNTNGQINIPSGGAIVCPTGAQPAFFTSYNDNTVGETISGSSGTPGIYNTYTQSGTDVNTFLNVTNVTLSNMRFSYAYSPFEEYATVTLRNCEFFYDADMYVQASQIFNNLFVNVIDLDWFPGLDNNTMQNNTFSNSAVFFDSYGYPSTDAVSDNLFDSTQIADWTYYGTTGGNNAFYNCTDYLGGNAGLPTDTTYSGEPGYQSGPLGDYYLPSNSPLIDGGDMLATDAGLDTFTTQTTQTPDSGTVDIGYHYPITGYYYPVVLKNSSMGTNFWVMFYNMYEGGPTLSLLISSQQGASGTATVVANGSELTLSGCDEANVNGTYVRTNMSPTMLSLFESGTYYQFDAYYNPGQVYLKDATNIVCLDYLDPQWDVIVYNPGDPNSYHGFVYLYQTSSQILSNAVWGEYYGSDTPPTNTVCSWGPVTLPFTMAAGGATNLVVPADAMVWDYDQVEDRGVQVTSTAPVAVYGMNYTEWASTAFTAYPKSFLGTNYCLLALPISEFGIVATESNTTVTITPSPSAMLQGSLWQNPITLQPGQIYQINSQTGYNPYPDVTGTRISSDKPIAVFAGNKLADVPDAETAAANSVVQEQIPVEDWGTEAMSLSFAGRTNGDTYRVLAAYSNTVVSITGMVVTIDPSSENSIDYSGPWTVTTTNETVVTNLTAGQCCNIIVDGPAVFQANQPIQVAKFANGADYDDAHSPTGTPFNGDPCEILLSPVGQWLETNIVVTLTNDLPNQAMGDFDENYLNLIVPQSATNSTYVDGSLVDVANYVPIGTSGYFGAQITIVNSGAHSVISSQPVEVEVYGWGEWDAYGYFGGSVK